ncbi:MAG: PIN domain-containing protein [Clostridia bacterium]|nr:PIN domain-containing protein [Clostridia bacterium]
MKVLIDTCVIIDALQSRKPFSENAEKIILAAANNHIEGFITAKAVTDIYYLTHRLTLSDVETCRIITTLMELVGIIDTTDMDCRRAVSSVLKDYEDAVMVESAKRSGMDAIVTRSEKDYATSPVAVYLPDDLLALLSSEGE